MSATVGEPASVEDKKPDFTTLRFHGEDGRDIARLAALRNVTIADLYRELCAKTIREALKKAMRSQLADLGGEGG